MKTQISTVFSSIIFQLSKFGNTFIAQISKISHFPKFCSAKLLNYFYYLPTKKFGKFTIKNLSLSLSFFHFFDEQRETIETKTHLIPNRYLDHVPCKVGNFKTGFFREVLSWQKTMALEKLVVRIYQVASGSLLGHSHGSPDITWRGNFPANCERFSWKSKPRFTNICAPRGRPLVYGKLEFELASGQLLCHLENFQLVLNTWSI